MKSVIEIDEQLNITLVSSTDDGSNTLIIKYSESTKLVVAGTTASGTPYTIPENVWSGNGSFDFIVSNKTTSQTFTVNKLEESGNMMIQRISANTFSLLIAKTSDDISEKTIDVIDTITTTFPEIKPGDKVSTVIGKIKKYLSDLGTGGGGSAITIKSTSVSYASSSTTTIPTGGWSYNMPSVEAGNYLWTKTVVTYSDGTVTTTYTYAKQGKAPQMMINNNGHLIAIYD